MRLPHAIAVLSLCATFGSFTAIPVGLCCLPQADAAAAAPASCPYCVHDEPADDDGGRICDCCPTKVTLLAERTEVPPALLSRAVTFEPHGGGVFRPTISAVPRGPPRSVLQVWRC